MKNTLLRSAATCLLLAAASPGFAQQAVDAPPATPQLPIAEPAAPEAAVLEGRQVNAGVGPVTAQTASIGAPRGEDSTSLKPVGAHFGSFTFFPKLEGAVLYDDNIYALETKTSDTIFRLSPSARLVGDFGRDNFTLTSSLDRLFYSKRETENRTDWRVNASNRYEIAAKTNFGVSAGFANLHEDRGDPNATTTNVSPTLYKRTSAGVSLTRDLARLRAGIRLNYAYMNYYDARQIGGGVTTNNDRDRSTYGADVKLAYMFSPGYGAMVTFGYDKVDYRLQLDDVGFNRSSEGWRVLAGVQFELSRLLTGSATAGYVRRTYDDARYRPTNRLNFNVGLDWNVTELTLVNLTVNRGIEETVAPGYSGFVASTYAVRVEHELLRSLKLSTTARYVQNNYVRTRGATVPRREEKYYGASIGARYDFNRNLYAVVGYDWNKKTSTAVGAGSEFNRNKVSLSVGLQL
ncbi:outer membrane beta-barrel protein [Sphingomonas montanisoli]|uniref:Outer membrane beta-barrel protein n=1 Tax=Sphingomonas montanisoli TaxID=2606412 RepID=A0A5D9C3H5_9SPHN|nr:outer membrane beta-barrel protein [Sphingomonas montanisoli]TZG25837.1 outer membrane beta-barrel protein [Sphingomonas montanisoli]